MFKNTLCCNYLHLAILPCHDRKAFNNSETHENNTSIYILAVVYSLHFAVRLSAYAVLREILASDTLLAVQSYLV